MNKKRSLFILLVGLLVPLFSYSQTDIKVLFGQILDTNGDPLPWAHVSLNDSIGTISNDSGYFQLRILATYKGSLIISEIGYKTMEVPLSMWQDTSFLVIRMEEAFQLLDIVTVTSRKADVDSAYLIMMKVLKNLEKNYPKRRYSMEVFYRESSIVDTTFTRLVEGQFLMSDKGYDMPVDEIAIQKLHLRKTEDYRELDWRESLSEWLYRKNGIFQVLKMDRLRIREKHHITEYLERGDNSKSENEIKKFMSEQFVENTYFSLVRSITNDESINYVIEYKIKTTKEILDPNFNFIANGQIIIEGKDWAILSWRSNHTFDEENFINTWRAKYLEKPEGFHGDFRYLLGKNYVLNDGNRFSINLQYRKHKDGNYYLRFIDFKTIGTNSGFFHTQSFEQQWQSRNTVGNIYTRQELYVTKIMKYKKIKWMDEVGHGKDIYDLSITREHQFWETYNYPAITPISGKMVGDLQQGKDNADIFIK